MTVCTIPKVEYARFKRRKIEAEFTGGDITSDGGVILLREVDKRLNFTARVAELFEDTRCKGKVRHPLLPMLRQRIYGIALGYEDLNDHQTLRKDKAIQTAVERDRDLASSSTLCLFADRTSCMNWLPNQLRLLLSGLAYTLFEAIRSMALTGTELARARCDR